MNKKDQKIKELEEQLAQANKTIANLSEALVNSFAKNNQLPYYPTPLIDPLIPESYPIITSEISEKIIFEAQENIQMSGLKINQFVCECI